MSGSLNKVMLIGNLGRDPEIRTLGSGDRVANLRLATSESWRDKSTGDRKEKTEWHSVVIFNEHLVKVAEQYLKKGSTIYVEGSLQTRKWTDQQGQDKYSTEVVLKAYNGTLTMLGGRKVGDAGDRGSDYGSSTGGGSSGYGASSGGVYGGASGGAGYGAGGRIQNGGPKESFPADLDDDIPFISRETVW